MEDLERYKIRMIESLKFLALPYEQQKVYLPDFADKPFEILDTFFEAFLLLPGQIEEGIYSNAALAAIVRVHNWISAKSYWDVRDMEEGEFSSGKDWGRIRELAVEALNVLGQPVEGPDPNYI